MTAPVSYNPYAFAVHDDPYDSYRQLRDEAPAWWNDELQFWVLSRFADVQEGFRDHRTFSSMGGVALENRRSIAKTDLTFQQMIELDPPEHTVFRRLVSRVFAPRVAMAMEQDIRSIVDGYIDAVIESGTCDLVDDITGPFPMDVISAVLGIPVQDRTALRTHADKILIREDGSMAMPQAALDGMFGLLDYFIKDLATRRTEARSGLISDLINVEVDGRKLTESELLGFCVLFVIAGHETTTKMVANAIEILSRHRDQRDRLVADPSLIPDALEEVLRYHSSTQYMHRTLTRDIEIHGQTMNEGSSVLLLIGGANHDDREYGPTADQFQIDRRAERHLAFGYGSHFCLGAALGPHGGQGGPRADPETDARLRCRSRGQGALSQFKCHRLEQAAALVHSTANVMPAEARVGYVGLGQMGAAMASRLCTTGKPVVVYDQDEQALAAVVALGAQEAASAGELATRCDIISICVPADRHIRQVFTGDEGLHGGCRAGQSILIHSTVAPETIQWATANAAPWGVSVFDVCVAGGTDVARAGDLVILAGGVSEMSPPVVELLNTYGSLVIDGGPVGAGAALKIGVNTMTYAQFAAASSVFAIVESTGGNPQALMQAWRHTGQLGKLTESFTGLLGIPKAHIKGAFRVVPQRHRRYRHQRPGTGGRNAVHRRCSSCAFGIVTSCNACCIRSRVSNGRKRRHGTIK